MLIVCPVKPSCSSRRPSDPARHHRHGAFRHHPSSPSFSALPDLAATSPTDTDNPPSRPISPIDTWDSSNPSPSSPTRPIPIPRRPIPAFDDQPVIPLTGRFDKGPCFPPISRPTKENKHQHKKHRRDPPLPGHPSRMRSDHPSFRSPVTSPGMSPSARPASPQQSRRAQNPSKSVPAFHLGSLPRFHPAVYQSSGSGQSLAGQPPSPRMSRQSNYRPSSGARDGTWQYRELMEGVSVPKTPPGPLSPGPSAPRLDPLRSPGPVTPLALEEQGGYLATGAANSSEYSSRDKQPGGGPDAVEMFIARENERARQKAKTSAKGR